MCLVGLASITASKLASKHSWQADDGSGWLLDEVEDEDDEDLKTAG